MTRRKITTLFCDIGGVLLTNGWDHKSREKAAEQFNFDFTEFDSRHRLIFGDYEVGKITLDDYLRYTLFYEDREFTQAAFKEFMYAQSQPLEGMLAYVRTIKNDYNLKVVMVSNEGRELTDYRIKTFKLDEIGDFFVVSCFAGVKKPDRQIFHMAIDMSQSKPQETLYFDDRQLFVDMANDMGIHGICHKDLKVTKAAVDSLLA